MGSGPSEFDKGHQAGTQDQRLDNLDAHFVRVNGSIDRSALAVETLTAAVTKLTEGQTRRERMNTGLFTIAGILFGAIVSHL